MAGRLRGEERGGGRNALARRERLISLSNHQRNKRTSPALLPRRLILPITGGKGVLCLQVLELICYHRVGMIPDPSVL